MLDASEESLRYAFLSKIDNKMHRLATSKNDKILWYYVGIYQTKKLLAKRVDNKKTFEGRTLSEDEDEPRILTVLPIWI